MCLSRFSGDISLISTQNQRRYQELIESNTKQILVKLQVQTYTCVQSQTRCSPHAIINQAVFTPEIQLTLDTNEDTPDSNRGNNNDWGRQFVKVYIILQL
ncbi:Hypothetical_protein [Hexamita inflata]|uniref:Hypothetical_protein n=1 Tax=Hexamita inflata TaxID=28002 RepID=A0ABP1GYD4_9EUKA